MNNTTFPLLLQSRAIFLVIFFILCVHGCSSRGDVTSTLPQHILDSTATLNGDTVFRLPKTVMAAYYRNGRIITVSQHEKMLVKVLDINTGATVDSLIEYGADGDRFLSGFPRIYRYTLIVLDLIRQQMALIDMDSAASGTKSRPDIRRLHLPEMFAPSAIIPYGNALLCLNPFCFKSPDGTIDNKDERRFIVSDCTGNFPDPGIHEFMTSNVAQGTVLASPENDRLVFLHKYDDIIEIYSWKTLEKLYEITGPTDIRNTFGQISGLVAVTQNHQKAYLAGIAGGDRLTAALSNGDNLYILQLDWNGNPLSCRHLGKATTYSLSLSEDGNELFTLQYATDGTPVMIRYAL